MKIAFVSHGLKTGGAEKFLINLINGLSDRQYQLIIILLDDENPLLGALSKSIKVHILKRKFRFDLTLSFKLRKTLIREGITKVLCIETFPFFISKLLFQFNNKIKFYLSLHNSLPISRKQHLADVIYLKFFRKSDTAIFICNYQKLCFKEKYFMNPIHSVVIYNGIDTEYFSASKAYRDVPQTNFMWKTRLGLEENSKTVLMVGRLSIEKGHSYAIQALSYMHRNLNFPAHLVIVGTGPDKFLENLQASCLALGIEKYVHFLGNSSEVRPFLLTADLFTLTSFSETFSIAALEAMSCGIPCSLTNVGGASEMLADENIGLLSETRNPVSIAESWKKLLLNPLNRQYISGYTASHFSFEKMLDNYNLLLKE